MRQLLNTLYITTPDSYLSRDGETALVRVGDEVRLRVPIHTLGSIICIGRVMCTPGLMALCAEHQVYLAFLNEHGRFIGRFQGPVSGNVLLRREQYRIASDETRSLSIAACFVAGKIANARTVLLRGARESEDQEASASLEGVCGRMGRLIELAQSVPTLDCLRGIEGEAGRGYFAVLDHLITVEKESFFLRERSRRPPLDNVNALVSFLYTLLVGDCVGGIESVGLDPAVGFLHQDRPGRPSLALDLMEELRSVVADRVALTLINRRQIKPSGFSRSSSGAVTMNEATRKEVLIAWQKRKQEEIQHPFLGEKVAIGLLPYIQALLLARHIRGGLDAYPTFCCSCEERGATAVKRS
jgi:CRISP-associated protein Cas1